MQIVWDEYGRGNMGDTRSVARAKRSDWESVSGSTNLGNPNPSPNGE